MPYAIGGSPLAHCACILLALLDQPSSLNTSKNKSQENKGLLKAILKLLKRRLSKYACQTSYKKINLNVNNGWNVLTMCHSCSFSWWST